MERRLEVLTKLVRVEDKIRGEYSTCVEMQEGVEEMYEILLSLNPSFRLSCAYNQACADLKHLESRDISPREFSISNLLKEIIRSTNQNSIV